MSEEKKCTDASSQEKAVDKKYMLKFSQILPFLKKNLKTILLCVVIIVMIVFSILLGLSINNYSSNLVKIVKIVLVSALVVSAIAMIFLIVFKELNKKWINIANRSANDYRIKLKRIVDQRSNSDDKTRNEFIETLLTSEQNSSSSNISSFSEEMLGKKGVFVAHASAPTSGVSYLETPQYVNSGSIIESLSSSELLSRIDGTHIPVLDKIDNASVFGSEKASDLDEMQDQLIDQISAVREECDISINQTKMIVIVAIGSFILGFVLLIVTILLPMFLYHDMSASLTSTVSTALVDFISLTLFVIYNKTMKQIRSDRLLLVGLLNQLNSICLFERISSPTERDNMIKKIILNSIKLTDKFSETLPKPRITTPNPDNSK